MYLIERSQSGRRTEDIR